MSVEPIISVSGLRGIVGKSLTPDVVVRYVRAFCAVAGPGPILVTRDGRATGPTLVQLVRGTLSAAGRDVLDAGVAATPTTGVLVRQHGAAGGIQISASHNPLPYNGMKLFGGDGRVISADRGSEVGRIYQQPEHDWAEHAALGSLGAVEDTVSKHLRLVLDLVDVPRIVAAEFCVLLDSNHGAGSLLGRLLLEQLGCRVHVLGESSDGNFAHPPEPTAENLSDVGPRVTEHGACIGFCQDPDADRLALLDERGRYIGEEYTLAICVRHILATRPGPIVVNCSTSRMSQDLAESAGVPCVRAKVGEANVADCMLEHQAVFGGEGNGGPIEPRVGYVRDSFVGMALVLEALAQSGNTLSQLVETLPRYAIHKAKVPLAREAVEAATDRLAEHFKSATADRLDGLRLDWSDRWLQVRASNTEPIVRIIAEAPDTDSARELCAAAQQILTDA